MPEFWQVFYELRAASMTGRAASAAPQTPRRRVLGTPRTAPIPGAIPPTNIHPFTHPPPQTPPSTADTTCPKPPSPPPRWAAA